MHHLHHLHHTEAIRLTERLLCGIEALGGARDGISAAVRAGTITPDAIYHLLDLVTADMTLSAQQLLDNLTADVGD
jgi:hypothetical protein